jgi:hypothetical protein
MNKCVSHINPIKLSRKIDDNYTIFDDVNDVSHPSELYRIMKNHWRNSIHIKNHFDISTLSRQNTMVYATYQGHVDESYFDIKLPSRTVFFPIADIMNNRPPETPNRYTYKTRLDLFVCDFVTFSCISNIWKFIEDLPDMSMLNMWKDEHVFLYEYLLLNNIKIKVGAFNE